jgi:hypothetical protein
MSRRAILLTALATTALLGFGILFAALSNNSPPIRALTVEFKGYTTNESGALLGTLIVANRSTRPIHYVVFAPQVADSSTWPANLGPPMLPNVPPPPLSPGNEVMVSVDAPYSGDQWRVPVLFSFHPSRWELFQYQLRTALQARSLRPFKGGVKLLSYTNFSEALSIPDTVARLPARGAPVPSSGRPGDYE